MINKKAIAMSFVALILLGCEAPDYLYTVNLAGSAEIQSTEENSGQVCAALTVKFENENPAKEPVVENRRICSKVTINNGKVEGKLNFKNKIPTKPFELVDVKDVSLVANGYPDAQIPKGKLRQNTYTSSNFTYGVDAEGITVQLSFQLATWDLIDILAIEDIITACKYAFITDSGRQRWCINSRIPPKITRFCQSEYYDSQDKVFCISEMLEK